ncbi:hypothetical protein VA249_45870 (plasmid) [Vibrio alfacsensis]|nr:hypothetical protein VA249_45870 [Vibrio alfacsensis]
MKAIRIIGSILSLPLLIVFVLPIWCYLVLISLFQPKHTHTRAELLGNQIAAMYKKFVDWSW